MMKRLLVLLSILLLLIGIACSFIGSREQPAEEDRIATSVAGTVAAQTNQDVEPTDTPVPVIPTPLPTVMPTPTQNLTILPTATPNPTVPPTTTPTLTETPSMLAVGDTVFFEPYAVTLVNANVGNSFESRFNREEGGSQRQIQAREGYTYVFFDIEYVVTKFNPGTAVLLYGAVAKDKDGDTYNCGISGSGLTYTVEPGYGGYDQMYCEAPLTAISSLDHVQLELKLTLQGNPHKDAKYTFELDKQSQNSAQVSVEKEREKHFPMDQPFTVTCGTQYHVEYVFANPRWSDLDADRFGYGFKRFSVDLVMTNPGKTNAKQIMFKHGLFFEGIGYAAGITYVPPEDNIRDFPIPGGTGRYRLNFTLPPTEVVPLISHWPQPNFEKDCELKIGNHVIQNNHDYFVIEVDTTDTTGTVIEDEISLQPTDEPTTSSVNLSCSNEPRGEFHNLWAKYQGQLGCPLQIEPLTGDFVEQPFEGGHMFWFAQLDLAFITMGVDQGDWTLYKIEWVDNGSPESCNVQVPAGKIQPIRGFGWIWCREQEIQNRLGWALDTERGFSAGVDLIQGFENGIIFRDSDGKTQEKAYVMFGKDKGTFVKGQY